MTNPYAVYLIADTQTASPKQIIKTLPQLLLAGVSCVQLRAKNLNHTEIIELGQQLHQITQHYQVPLLINDHIDLVSKIGAEGAHIGQQDMDILTARAHLGSNAILGLSIENTNQAKQYKDAPVDYFGVGPIYATTSKPDASPAIGTEGLKQICQQLTKPIVAIGGINLTNCEHVLQAGANGLAMISCIWQAKQPTQVLSQIKQKCSHYDQQQAVVLTIAGSDSGGGAGVQADIKTICCLGGYACSVITALTAQNTQSVSAIEAVAADFVRKQLTAVLTDIRVEAVKIGMLHRPEVISVVMDTLARANIKHIVFDPVMVAQSGAKLLDQKAIKALEQALHIATVITPNLPEAEQLMNQQILTIEDAANAAADIAAKYKTSVLLKGGHAQQPHEANGMVTDILFDYEKQQLTHYQHMYINTENTHGTGCTLSAAIATKLAQGQQLAEAIPAAIDYLQQALAAARNLRLGHGAGPVHHNYQVVNDSK